MSQRPLFLGGQLGGTSHHVVPPRDTRFQINYPDPQHDAIADLIRNPPDLSDPRPVPVRSEVYWKCEMPDGSVAFVLEEQIESRGAIRFPPAEWEREEPRTTIAPDGYPEGWPRCAAGCGRPALDGKRTCGDARCG